MQGTRQALFHTVTTRLLSFQMTCSTVCNRMITYSRNDTRNASEAPPEAFLVSTRFWPETPETPRFRGLVSGHAVPETKLRNDFRNAYLTTTIVATQWPAKTVQDDGSAEFETYLTHHVHPMRAVTPFLSQERTGIRRVQGCLKGVFSTGSGLFPDHHHLTISAASSSTYGRL